MLGYKRPFDVAESSTIYIFDSDLILGKNKLRPLRAILPLMKVFLPSPLEMKYAPDEKNYGHASALLYENIVLIF